MPQRLGQHFLRDRGVLNAITKALRLESRDRVLEIGPGQGVLTRELARQAGKVFAIELDRSLVERLRETFGAAKNVTIIHADALETDPCTLWDERPDGDSSPPIGVSGGGHPPYKLAGNIPYYITGALLRRYLGTPCPPSLSVLMVQLEVARRIVAQPGQMNMLALSAQLRTTPTVVARVPAKAFRPAPKVESAVILLETLPRPRVETHGNEIFFAVARAGFSSRRKQLVNSLANGLAIEKSVATAMLAEANVEPSRRAQDLTLEEWSRVACAHATRIENGTSAGIPPSDTEGRAAQAVVGT